MRPAPPPFKTKVVEPIEPASPARREQALAQAGHSTMLLQAQDISQLAAAGLRQLETGGAVQRRQWSSGCGWALHCASMDPLFRSLLVSLWRSRGGRNRTACGTTASRVARAP
jgi:hypothetical protein